jgi:predicted transcriptional regulator of viral defense system
VTANVEFLRCNCEHIDAVSQDAARKALAELIDAIERLRVSSGCRLGAPCSCEGQIGPRPLLKTCPVPIVLRGIVVPGVGEAHQAVTVIPMATTSISQREQTLVLLKERGVMRLADLMAKGIAATTLARLVSEGSISRIARGLYELPDADVSLGHSLAEIAVRVPTGVVCLISALPYHEITLQNPRSVWIAIGEKDRKPKAAHLPVRFTRFGKKALTLGVKTVTIDKVPVRISTPTKTVVDCFRYRSTVGLDVTLEALRMALRARKATPDSIADMAKKLRIWTVIAPYLESVVADAS